MFTLKDQDRLFLAVLVVVLSIIGGAASVSVASILENKRFVEATSKILWIVRTVRSAASAQRIPSLDPGDDVWAALIQSGQVSATMDRSLPWGGTLDAHAATRNSVRVETFLPSHNCRRIALYFLSLEPTELHLLSVAAKPMPNASWSLIYPLPDAQQVDAAVAACGDELNARLALTFMIN
ncbi:MAG: hypothetical protein PHS57_09400 [Alphaproteobacteria bacterium]|nr:hypothetical protein [Alphaproteobacteria bacterium]